MTKRTKPKRDRNALKIREIQIIRMVCQEMSSKQIGAELGFSRKSIETYRQTIMRKIGAINTAGLVVYAIRNGIYDINS